MEREKLIHWYKIEEDGAQKDLGMTAESLLTGEMEEAGEGTTLLTVRSRYLTRATELSLGSGTKRTCDS